MALIHSILIGAVAGMRAMTPLASVAAAARTGALPADTGAPDMLTKRLAAPAALALAVGELAGDKLPSAPDRTASAGMAARMVTGAISGAALAPRRQRITAALLGATAAMAATYLGLQLRERASERYGPVTSGLIEDAFAVGSAAAVTRSASRA